MTVSGSGLDDRDRTLVYHCFDQSSSATWDQYIHIPVQLHKFRSRFSGGILDQLDSILDNAAGLQCLTDTVDNGSIGMNCVASTLQDHDISSFEAETECI